MPKKLTDKPDDMSSHEKILQLKKHRKTIEKLMSGKFDPYHAILERVEKALIDTLKESKIIDDSIDKDKWIIEEFMKKYDERILGIVK
jgi:hypothetical protein